MPSISRESIFSANKANQSLAILRVSMLSGREETPSLLKVGKDASDGWGDDEDIVRRKRDECLDSYCELIKTKHHDCLNMWDRRLAYYLFLIFHSWPKTQEEASRRTSIVALMNSLTKDKYKGYLDKWVRKNVDKCHFRHTIMAASWGPFIYLLYNRARPYRIWALTKTR